MFDLPKLKLDIEDIPIFLREDIVYNTVDITLIALEDAVSVISQNLFEDGFWNTNRKIDRLIFRSAFNQEPHEYCGSSDNELFISEANLISLNKHITEFYQYLHSVISGVKTGEVRINHFSEYQRRQLTESITNFNTCLDLIKTWFKEA